MWNKIHLIEDGPSRTHHHAEEKPHHKNDIKMNDINNNDKIKTIYIETI